MVAMLAGSDFIKTSTGKEAVNATVPVGIVMCRAIYDYYRHNFILKVNQCENNFNYHVYMKLYLEFYASGMKFAVNSDGSNLASNWFRSIEALG